MGGYIVTYTHLGSMLTLMIHGSLNKKVPTNTFNSNHNQSWLLNENLATNICIDISLSVTMCYMVIMDAIWSSITYIINCHLHSVLNAKSIIKILEGIL